MTAIPERENTTANAIDEWHEQQPDPFRPHLGASLLGHHCDRYLWLSFRWAFKEQFSGRMRRLFRRGHLEELQVVSDLRNIGIEINDTGGEQARVNFGCHISGSLDGKIERGVPEAPKARHVLEVKTYSKKSFDDLVSKGVEASKPQHFAQMQVYMHGTGIERALYVAVCKDDDRLHTERVRYDKDIAEKLIARGKRIALSDTIPEPCPGGSPEWYLCKFCPAYSMCWQEQPTQQINCRTCAHSTALETSEFRCELWRDVIPVDAQRDGCHRHVLHPDIVPWPIDPDASTEDEAAYIIDGQLVRNGEADAFTFSSREILDGKRPGQT